MLQSIPVATVLWSLHVHLMVSQQFQGLIWCTTPESEWSPIVYVVCGSSIRGWTCAGQNHCNSALASTMSHHCDTTDHQYAHHAMILVDAELGTRIFAILDSESQSDVILSAILDFTIICTPNWALAPILLWCAHW